MAKRVAEMTDGELRLKVYPARQLGEEKDTILATLFGAIDINRVSSAPLGTMVPEVIMMSGDRWDRLSGEQQNIILQADKEAELMMRQLWRERVEQARNVAIASGVEVIDTVDLEAFARAADPLYGPFRENPVYADWIERIQRLSDQ